MREVTDPLPVPVENPSFIGRKGSIFSDSTPCPEATHSARNARRTHGSLRQHAFAKGQCPSFPDDEAITASHHDERRQRTCGPSTTSKHLRSINQEQSPATFTMPLANG